MCPPAEEPVSVAINFPLEVESEYFESQRQMLLQHHEGQFALISGQRILGTYTTEAEAYEAGLSQLGNRPFLIRQIRSEEPTLQAPVLFVGLNVGTL